MTLRNFVYGLRVPGLVASGFVATWLILTAFGFGITSPGQAFQTHRIEHNQLEGSLEAILGDLRAIDASLSTLVRLRCIESDPATIRLSGLDCS